jgi:hypothetical protein
MAVFTLAVRDLCLPDTSRERREALAWLGHKRPTRDFATVAGLLGYDIEATWERLRAVADRPPAGRRAVAAQAVEHGMLAA